MSSSVKLGIEQWEAIIGKDWAQRLSKILLSEGMEKLMEFVSHEYNTFVVYPDMQDVFKAFRLCPPGNLKVVILGQDPYHDGSATGLAFANSENTVKMSPSLEQIWKECEKATETISIDFDVTLESWAKQGVLLLNTALTVKKSSPTSHSPFWHPFTRAVLKHINDNFNGLHICLWGSHARSFGETFNKDIHHIYHAAHPVAHVYSGGTGWKCNHFQKINDNLKLQNGENEIISW